MRVHRSHLVLIFGSASSFLGSLVMLAWHANLPILIQTQSTFVPMQYNTALGFLFSGLGLILVKFSRVGLGKFVGILVSLLGGLTLIQYFFDIDFGIDELVIESFIQIQTSHPGRMAPNTALSFFLFGVYLLCWNNRNKSSIDVICSGILGTIIFTVGLVALLGYLLGWMLAYGWGDFTRMAIHTSVGFIFLGLGIIGLVWDVGEENGAKFPSWFSGVVFIGGVTATLLLWQAQVEEKEKTIISNAILILGILMAFLLSMTAHFFRKERILKYQAKNLHDKNLHEMEERFLIQKSLIESKEHFKTLVEKMNDGLVTQDVDGNLTFVNKKFCDMFGFSREEILGKAFSHFIKKDKEKNYQERVDSTRLGDIMPFESIGITKDKKTIYLIISPEMIVDSKGQCIGSFCIITDVTELKVIQKSLARQKEELNTIFNSVPAMIWYKNRENKILRANQSAAESIGLSVEEVEGKSTFELYPVEAQQYHKDDLEVIQTGKPKLGIVEIYKGKNNEIRWVQTDKIPYRDEIGEIKGVIVFAVDITARKIAQDELNKYKDHLEELVSQRQKELVHSEARFRQIILDAPIPMMVYDDKGNVLTISRRWTELSGYSHDEIPTISNWVSKAYENGQADNIQQVFMGVFESNKLIYQGEFEIITSNGEKRTWDFYSKPFIHLAEDRKYAVSMAVDISDRKMAEQSLRKSQEQLVHAEKLNATGKLSASIAHEFNNPIYGIRNVLEKIKDDIPMDATYGGFVNLAIKECNRVSDLIQKLNEFHCPSPDILEHIDIHKIIDETIIWVQKGLKQKRITLKKDYANDIPEVEVVSDQIKQVILNLIQNAEEAISNGRGYILIKTEFCSSIVKIRIRDNGVGVDNKNFSKIFDPFFTTKSAVKGTGLGLFVSYGIIKAHGGNIEINRQLDRGAEFIITLPLKMVNNEK